MNKLLALKGKTISGHFCEECKERPISCFGCGVGKAIQAGDVIEAPEPVAELLVCGRLAMPEPGVKIDTSRFVGLREFLPDRKGDKG
ncbi:MAG TPA: hypothetical protein VL122_06875 [Nitrospirota bacterium]|nr:hypothetical protein [Nitrospirota bacterium]